MEFLIGVNEGNLDLSTIIEKGMKVKGLGTIPGVHKVTVPEGGFPEGTIRSWAIGDAVKRNGKWVLIEIPDRYHKLGSIIDSIAKDLQWKKDPVKGEKLVDHLLKKHFEDKELQWGEFKNYSKWGQFLGFQIDKGLYQLWVAHWLNGQESKSPSHDRLEGIIKELEQYREIYKTKNYGLSEEDDKTYNIYMNYLDELLEEYIPYQEVLGFKKQVEEFIEKHKDNFIVHESLKTKLEDNFHDYKSKFRDRILEDEKARLQNKFDIDLEKDSPEKFYRGIEKGFSVGEDMSILLDGRFYQKLKLILKGNWTKDNFGALYNFENLIEALPYKHVLGNPDLETLKNHSYTGKRGDHNGYAFYSRTDREVSLSDQALSNYSKEGNLLEPNEFNSVLTHEVGHAVSALFRDNDNLHYKVFTMLCGWDNRQGEELITTAGQRSAPRRGRNSDRPLLTKYSHHAPEEAFAEYYSFYFLNKSKLDPWLNDINHHLEGLPGTSQSPKELEKLTDLELIYDLGDELYKYCQKRKIIPSNEVVIQKGLTENQRVSLINLIKDGYLMYRDDKIYLSIIKKNFDPLKLIKTKVFEQEKIIKAFEKLGIFS